MQTLNIGDLPPEWEVTHLKEVDAEIKSVLTSFRNIIKNKVHFSSFSLTIADMLYSV
jgi:hypothetical protein